MVPWDRRTYHQRAKPEVSSAKPGCWQGNLLGGNQGLPADPSADRPAADRTIQFVEKSIEAAASITSQGYSLAVLQGSLLPSDRSPPWPIGRGSQASLLSGVSKASQEIGHHEGAPLTQSESRREFRARFEPVAKNSAF